MYVINDLFFSKNIMYQRVLISSDQPNVQFYYYLSNIIFRRHTKQIFLFITISLIYPLRVFQCIWNFQSFQFWFSVFIFLFISSSFSCDFFLSLLLLRGGRFSFNCFMYQLPPIASNNDWSFYLWITGLGSWTRILWNIFIIV